MIVGDIKNQIDGIWNDFWSGGVSNPMTVMEQMTYLLFIRRLDELQSAEEAKAQTLKQPIARCWIPEGADPRGMPYERLRWSRFKVAAPSVDWKAAAACSFTAAAGLGVRAWWRRDCH